MKTTYTAILQYYVKDDYNASPYSIEKKKVNAESLTEARQLIDNFISKYNKTHSRVYIGDEFSFTDV